MTTPTFNLVDEPWIPCLPRGSAQPQDLSIRETLRRAPDLSEIIDPSPLVTVSLHRMLLAILHRCYGPATVDDWARLWQAGHWDEQVDTYLDTWKHRFDLFDPHHPFYQVADIPEELSRPIIRMTHELALGISGTLWEHRNGDTELRFTPQQATRSLVALHPFVLGGTGTHRASEKENKYMDGGPLANTAVVLVRGDTLFHTLMLNLYQYDGDTEPFATDGDDAPAWERSTPTRPGDRNAKGYLDLLTWQSRQIQFFPDEDTGMVGRVAVLKGYQFPESGYRHGRETMLAFRRKEDATGSQDPYPPLSFRIERTVWRDSETLYQSHPKTRDVSSLRMLEWLARLAHEGVLTRRDSLRLDLFGLASDRATPLFWRHEHLPLPVAYLDNNDLLQQIHNALDTAEKGMRTLRWGLSMLAERSIVPYLPAEGLNRNDRDRAKELVRAWGGERQYWSSLDLAFRRFLEALPEDHDPEQGFYGMTVSPAWIATVQDVARDTFDDIARSLDTSARWSRAVAYAAGPFHGAVKGLGTDTDLSDEGSTP